MSSNNTKKKRVKKNTGQSRYNVEGFIKNIVKSGNDISLMIEATAPYLFESKEKKEDASATRKILLVADGESDAHICAESVGFKMAKADFTALLIAKANHMKVRLTVYVDVDVQKSEECESTATGGGKNPLVVSKLEVL